MSILQAIKMRILQCLLMHLALLKNKTIDQILPLSHTLKNQNANNQMSNWVSFVESLSRPFLNKKQPKHKIARWLGTWAYTGPGLENEIIGKIEKDGIVNIKNSTIDLVWYSVKWNDIEGWVPASKLDFTTLRNLYSEFDTSNVLMKNNRRFVEKYTNSAVGVRTYPNLASHWQTILEPKSKVTILMQRQNWYQITWRVKNKIFKGWIPSSYIQDTNKSTKITSLSRNKSNIESAQKSPKKSILKDSRAKLTESHSPTRHMPQKSLVILDLKESKITPTNKRSDAKINESSQARKAKLDVKVKFYFLK